MQSQEFNVEAGLERFRALARELMTTASEILMQIGYLESQLTDGVRSSNMNNRVTIVEQDASVPDIYENMPDPYGTSTDGEWEPINGDGVQHELPFSNLR